MPIVIGLQHQANNIWRYKNEETLRQKLESPTSKSSRAKIIAKQPYLS